MLRPTQLSDGAAVPTAAAAGEVRAEWSAEGLREAPAAAATELSDIGDVTYLLRPALVSVKTAEASAIRVS